MTSNKQQAGAPHGSEKNLVIDSMAMPPPASISPRDIDTRTSTVRPRSESLANLSRSGTLPSSSLFDGYPSLHAGTPPEAYHCLMDQRDLSPSASPLIFTDPTRAAALSISPAFRQSSTYFDMGREESESPVRTETPSEDVFAVDWAHSADRTTSGMPAAPSKEPPPSPRPQGMRWTEEHENGVSGRRRKIGSETPAMLGAMGETFGNQLQVLQIGQSVLSNGMELDNHLDSPTQFTNSSSAARGSIRRRVPSMSVPPSPSKGVNA